MAVRNTREAVEVLGSEGITLAARLTRAVAEVLGRDVSDPPIQLTRMAVEVLADVPPEAPENIEVEAASVLSLTQSVVGGIITRTASSVLALTSVASVPIFGVAASSTITLSSTSSTPPIKTGAASSTITFTTSVGQHGPLPRSETSLIELTHQAVHHVPQPVDASHTLSLTHEALQRGPLPRSASSTLVLESTADNTVKIRSATTTLALTQAAVAAIVRKAFSQINLSHVATNGIVQLSATSELALVSTSRNTNIREVIPASQLEFTQEATSNIKMCSAESVIEITDSHDVRRPYYVTPSSELVEYTEVFDPITVTSSTVETGLAQSVSLTLLKVQRVQHYIQWTSTANGYADLTSGTAVSADSTLSLSQGAWDSRVGVASSSLTLSDSLVHYLAQYRPSSTIELTQSASANIDRAAASLESVIAVQQAVRFVLNKSDTHCLYSPFVGSTTDSNAPTPPPLTLPAASELTGVRLLYPSTGTATDEVVLRAPNLGNIDRLGMDRINRETRGGTLVIYADPVWPKVQTLVLSFSVLKKDEAYELLDFMESHLGEEIRLVDWEDRAWKGVIVNPQDPIVEDRRNSFSASFEFEGARE